MESSRSYTNLQDLFVKDDPDIDLALSHNDKLLGTKIIGISYDVDSDGDAQIVIDLSNGSTIEIYKHCEGKVCIESD